MTVEASFKASNESVSRPPHYAAPNDTISRVHVLHGITSDLSAESGNAAPTGSYLCWLSF